MLGVKVAIAAGVTAVRPSSWIPIADATMRRCDSKVLVLSWGPGRICCDKSCMEGGKASVDGGSATGSLKQSRIDSLQDGHRGDRRHCSDHHSAALRSEGRSRVRT